MSSMGTRVAAPVAERDHPGVDPRAQGGGRGLRAVLAVGADQHGGGHDQEDDPGVHHLAGRQRDPGREQEQEEQGAPQLPRQDPQSRERFVRAELIPSVHRQAALRLRRRQSDGRHVGQSPHTSSRIVMRKPSTPPAPATGRDPILRRSANEPESAALPSRVTASPRAETNGPDRRATS